MTNSNMAQVGIENFAVTKESVTVIYGGRPFVVKQGQPNFVLLRTAILEAIRKADWRDVPAHLSAGTSLSKWAKGRFRVDGDRLLYDDDEVPSDLASRISEMAANGEDPTPLLRFWENLQLNPSKRSVDQLWNFLNNLGIPLTADGCFLAYKGVRDDFKDCHSGTIDNRPGAKVRMERNKISDDPNHACHQGLHVGAREYASSFGPNVVICKVFPAHVVCVPNDHSFQKMRVCEYEVIGLDNGGYMPSTSIDEAEVPKAPAKTISKAGRSKGFQKLDSLDEAGLMDCKLETLRAYAARGLNVVGASRIPGGKWSLVQRILEARKALV